MPDVFRLPEGEAELFRIDQPFCTSCKRQFHRGPQGITERDNREVKEIRAKPGRDDDLCPECRKALRGLVRLVCLKCRRIVGRVQPGRTDGGYYAAPDTDLHFDGCPYCDGALYGKAVAAEAKGEHLFLQFVEDKIAESSKTHVSMGDRRKGMIGNGENGG